MSEVETIAAEGRNCWRREHAGRVAFLIDAQAYFSAFAAAAEQAEHSIFILGWDIDSRLHLNPDKDADQIRNTLGEFLNAIAGKKKGLHIYILTWDFSMIYFFDRELMPVFKLDWRTHSRIHFRLDQNHPPGASHHQKIVVIDDALAFSGGMDLTARRWDTPEHKSEDSRRIDPWGAPYHPFHDVQIMVDGDAAAGLGKLARDRWRMATGKSLETPPRRYHAWPTAIQPDIRDVSIMISRTGATEKGGAAAREVAELFFDMIKTARKSIYIENQYLTSISIGQALERRLEERDGPEIILITPYQCSGWLEQNTMGVYRTHLLRDLRRSDRYNRLYIYNPGDPNIEIHSKVLIVDEDIVRIGSANLSNRSLGLDTECDLAIESGGKERIRNAITDFRNRLLGEHLGTTPAAVAEMTNQSQTLGKAIEAIRAETGKLAPYKDSKEEASALCDIVLCDPEKPVNADKILEYMLPDDIQEPSRSRLMSIVAFLAALGAIAAAWHWTPLRNWAHPHVLYSFIEPFRYSILAPFFILTGYAFFGLFIPITVLVITTVLVFDPLPGFCYALTGCLASAAVSYGIGQFLGRNVVRKVAGSKLNRVSRHIIRHGFLAVTFLRIASVAPFTVINLIAGATRIKFKDYVLGTMAGMSPGLILLTLFGDRMSAALRSPDVKSLSILIAIIIFFLTTSAWLTRRFSKPATVKVNQ